MTLEVPPGIADGGVVDWAHVFGAMASFFLLMLLLSIGAEKITDLVKLFVFRSLDGRPKPRVQSYLLDSQRLVSLDDATLESLYGLMCPRGDKLKRFERIEAIDLADRERAQDQQRYSRILRLVALGAGVLIAWMLRIDLVAVLAPILDARTTEFLRAHAWVGPLLSGFGASAGAPFWQDLFDRMTAAKKSAEALGGKG